MRDRVSLGVVRIRKKTTPFFRNLMIGLSIARRSTRGGSVGEMRERGKLEVLPEDSAKYEAKNDCVAYMAREKNYFIVSKIILTCSMTGICVDIRGF